MAATDKPRNRTLAAMQRVWARKVLEQQTLKQGQCDTLQCKEAKTYLQEY